MSGAVNLVVNGEARSAPEGVTVAQLVAQLDRGPAGIAVARNGEVVTRSSWSTTALADGDQVEILTAAQGG